MSVGLVLVNHGTAESSLNAIRSARHHLLPILERIVVVENGTGERERFMNRGYETIDFPVNRGFAVAVNAAMERLRKGVRRPKRALLLNPDAWLLDGPWISFFSWMVSTVGAAGPAILSPGGRRQASSYSTPGRHGPILELLGAHRLVRSLGIERSMPDVRTEVEALQGSCLAISMEAWKEVGFFDESFFLYHEETDWCLRARDRGYLIVYDPSVKAMHEGGVDLPAGRETFYYRSLLRLVEKRSGAPAADLMRRRLLAASRLAALLPWNAPRRDGLQALRQELATAPSATVKRKDSSAR
jgi:hypothetical protein